MKTAEIIVNETLWLNHNVGFQKSVIIKLMKEYALNCAKQALEDAANNVRLCEKGEHGYDYDYPVISKQSILNTEIKTP